MPRCGRLDAPGVLHHVMGRGIEKRKVFINDGDRKDFVAREVSSKQISQELIEWYGGNRE
jgi:hypothetical protein